jgi:hypothetical protein
VIPPASIHPHESGDPESNNKAIDFKFSGKWIPVFTGMLLENR